jgi:hypothetical protein
MTALLSNLFASLSAEQAVNARVRLTAVLRVAVLTLVLSACAANPFTEFYRGTSDARKLPSYVAVPGGVKIYSTDNFERDVQELTRKSYSVVGRSSFSAASNNATDAQLREQARKIGAQIVLVRPGYTRTIYGALPLSSPQTTATPGSKALLMPSATMPNSDLAAVFLVKLFPRVGLSPGTLDDETRRRLKRNGGILVLEVVEGSPAFNAGVLPGDVLLGVGSERIQFVEQYLQALNQYQGTTVTFTFDRNGTLIEKQIPIRPYPSAAH